MDQKRWWVNKMSSSSANLIFDIDMSSGSKLRNANNEKTSLLLDEAHKKGYQEGLIKGKQDEGVRTAQAQLQAVNKLSQQCALILEKREETEKKAIKDALDIGKTIGRKLASSLLEKHPDAELNALIKECFLTIEDAPHLLIRCHPDLADITQKTAQEYMKMSSFSGRLIVMSDADTALGDGKIEWVDGGIIRSSKKTNEQIDRSINDFLNANNIATKEENEVIKTDLKESDK